MQKPWLSFYERGVPHTLAYSDLPLDTLLKRAARSYPSHTASNFILSYLLNGNGAIGGKLTYARLNELVDRFATALYQLGVRKGSRVALMLPNSPHFLIAFFATLRLGAVVVTINPAYTAREVHYQLDDSGAETIVLLNLFWPRLREIQSATALKRVVVAHIFDTLPFPHNLLVYARQRRQHNWVKVKPEHDIFFFNRLLTKYGPTPPHVEVHSDDIALFQYTGGTTGTPKAAMLTHRNLMANTTQCVAWVTDGRPGHEKSVAAVPFFHVYGLSVCLLYSVAIASEMMIVPDPRQIEQVMHIIQNEQCTLFPGVPAMYLAIVNHPKVRSYDLRSVRACISGSAPLPVEVQRRFDEVTGGRLVEGFGLSEASPVTHCNPLYGERRAGSIGIPFPDVDARLVDTETGEVLPLGSEQSGELQVRGPQVMSGYWNRPDDTRATLDAEGWLSTGDICSTDKDGYFYLIDRKKDMMIVGGYKVLPREVEEVLYMHPAVRQAAVVGVPDSERGDDIVTAFILSHPDEQHPSVEELRDFCRIHLAAYKIPRRIEYRNELPTTLVGKVLRRVLVEEAQSTEATTEQS